MVANAVPDDAPSIRSPLHDFFTTADPRALLTVLVGSIMAFTTLYAASPFIAFLGVGMALGCLLNEVTRTDLLRYQKIDIAIGAGVGSALLGVFSSIGFAKLGLAAPSVVAAVPPLALGAALGYAIANKTIRQRVCDAIPGSVKKGVNTVFNRVFNSP